MSAEVKRGRKQQKGEKKMLERIGRTTTFKSNLFSMIKKEKKFPFFKRSFYKKRRNTSLRVI
jgi:hypothetical protein